MAIRFDAGYADPRFAALVEEYPGEDAYPAEHYRVEWGPIFHRGRLDGTARVLVIGQDPGEHETIVRRILVGQAGRRIQGFLARLGITRSYVMINAFVYSVYGSADGGTAQQKQRRIAYRNRWLDALLRGSSRVEAVVALGVEAEEAYNTWKGALAQPVQHVFRRITHPTAPEGSGGEITTAALLQNWNAALQVLRPAVQHPDVPATAGAYGPTWGPNDRPELPDFDFPAGLPAWMREPVRWTRRRAVDGPGTTEDRKRATIVVQVPEQFRPW
jgi:uracil-DNA glycosylase